VITEKLMALSQPIVDFAEANKHLDDKALLNLIRESGLKNCFIKYIKTRGTADRRSLFRFFVDEL
jgi:hypothetical protein